jgi:hypothetical protein
MINFTTRHIRESVMTQDGEMRGFVYHSVNESFVVARG